MTHDTPPKRIWEDRMTDLTRERIEEIKKWKSLFDRGEVVNFLSVGETHDLARQLLAAMTERDEAQAAQAGVVERCAAEMDLAAHIMSHHGSFQEQRAYENAAKSIRSLADPTGVKLLAEMRSERDAALVANRWLVRLNDRTEARAIAAEVQLAEANTKITQMTAAWGEDALALDELRVQLAEAQKREAGLRAMIRVNMLRYGPADLMHEDIDRQIGAALSAAPTGEESNG